MVLAVATGGTVAGIDGAVVAVPLVAVGNTVVGYLRARPGASATDAAPVAPAREQPANAEDDTDR
nr:hypothetical protein [Streptomyces katrae]